MSTPAPRLHQHSVVAPAPRLALGKRMLSAFWVCVWAVFFRTSLPGCNRWRVGLLNLFGAAVHRSARVAPTVWVNHPWNLTVGENAVISHHAHLDCRAPIQIGDRSRIGRYCYLCAHEQDFDRGDLTVKLQTIQIGDGVWVGTDTYIGVGVTIGDRTVVGARTNVTDSLPPDVVAVGNPAKVVSKDNNLFSPDYGAAKA